MYGKAKDLRIRVASVLRADELEKAIDKCMGENSHCDLLDMRVTSTATSSGSSRYMALLIFRLPVTQTTTVKTDQGDLTEDKLPEDWDDDLSAFQRIAERTIPEAPFKKVNELFQRFDLPYKELPNGHFQVFAPYNQKQLLFQYWATTERILMPNGVKNKGFKLLESLLDTARSADQL